MVAEGTLVGGRYRILTQVGIGGMSTVYLAMDASLNRRWAVKQMRDAGSAERRDVMLRSLTVESEMIARLDHPAIPRIVDLIDDDEVCLTNLNRQIIATHDTIGRPKVEVFAERIHSINPDAVVHVHRVFFGPDTAGQFDFSAFDYVVDAIDTLAPKIFLIYHSLQLGLPVVSSMGSGGKLDPSKIQVADISKSYNCNLARMLRKRLHKLGVYKGVKVVFSSEFTDPASVVLSESQNKKSNVGTISYMPPLFGCFAASVVIRDLLDTPVLPGSDTVLNPSGNR